MSSSLASFQAATSCTTQAIDFNPDESPPGPLEADRLACTLGGDNAESAGVQPMATLQAVAADQPLSLLQLPAEVLLLVLIRLDAQNLARLTATCSALFREPMTPVEEALRQRAAERGHACPARLPEGATSWAAHLAWLESRRDEAWAPVAAGAVCSFFVADGRLMSCGADTEFSVRGMLGGQLDVPGSLGQGEFEGEDRVVRTPTLLPSMAGIRIRSVSAGTGFNAAVSAAGTVYTWGFGGDGRLGHGDTEGSLVPKQVQALAGHLVLSVTTGVCHCLAVTERGEVFSWGWDRRGQCGHGSADGSANSDSDSDGDSDSYSDYQLLPRCVEALAGVRARSASAGRSYSLVVTEEGALYSFGSGYKGQLGHGSGNDEHSPKMVDALRNVCIVAAATGGDHSLALAEDGMVFSWGGNTYGQLGLGRRRRRGSGEPLPQRVGALSVFKVCSVEAGHFFSCAVTVAGELFTWGYGGAEEHGPDIGEDQLAPRRVEALHGEWVVAVSASGENTIAVTRGGSVFGWGDANSLGLPDHANDPENMCWYGPFCILLSPRRYPQLSCERSP